MTNDKQVRKEVEEEFGPADNVEYENVKKVVGKGKYHIKIKEKEYAGC